MHSLPQSPSVAGDTRHRRSLIYPPFSLNRRTMAALTFVALAVVLMRAPCPVSAGPAKPGPLGGKPGPGGGGAATTTQPTQPLPQPRPLQQQQQQQPIQLGRPNRPPTRPPTRPPVAPINTLPDAPLRFNISLLSGQSAFWRGVQTKMLRALSSDIVFTCKAGSQCPCQPPPPNGGTTGPNTCDVATELVCGAISRSWFRAIFHDAGTFNKAAGTGGADGSLQFELDRAENPFNATINFYKDAIRNTTNEVRARGGVAPASAMADAIVLGGLLGLAACGGPQIPFTPGRNDATAANAAGLLPGRDSTGAVVVAAFARMGLTMKEGAALIGAGHTIASLNGESLDSSPRTFDTLFFKQITAQPGAGIAPVTLPVDRSFSQTPEAGPWFRSFAADSAGAADWMATLIGAVRKLASLGQPAAVF